MSTTIIHTAEAEVYGINQRKTSCSQNKEIYLHNSKDKQESKFLRLEGTDRKDHSQRKRIRTSWDYSSIIPENHGGNVSKILKINVQPGRLYLAELPIKNEGKIKPRYCYSPHFTDGKTRAQQFLQTH